MTISLWILEISLFLLFLHCINAIINPKKIVDWTVEKHKGLLKFYRFEGDIKATEESIKVIRNGHIIVAIILLIYMILIILFT